MLAHRGLGSVCNPCGSAHSTSKYMITAQRLSTTKPNLNYLISAVLVTVWEFYLCLHFKTVKQRVDRKP